MYSTVIDAVSMDETVNLFFYHVSNSNISYFFVNLLLYLICSSFPGCIIKTLYRYIIAMTSVITTNKIVNF